MPAEEDRSWNIVKFNSLKFTTWTALIDENKKGSRGDVIALAFCWLDGWIVTDIEKIEADWNLKSNMRSLFNGMEKPFFASPLLTTQ
ncbi:hypothetical protein VNO77_42133 [Canavalia gladiata]|uniref:Uncharacterized protein n=1 Tax=Canavalia gladiata TaxID=3824 RepID=A0AAN9PSK2_CANGL